MTERPTLGIDLGGTYIKAALVDREGRVILAKSRPTEAERGPEHVIDNIVALAAEFPEQAGFRGDDIAGVGVGSPGPMNLKLGTIIRAANLPGWENVPLRDRLCDRLKCSIVLENDANAAAFGEFWVGAGRDGRDFVLLTLGTGVGGGVILTGKILHGCFDNAAELGHIIVAPNGLRCPCGQRGCLEQYASASAVARRAAETIGTIRSPSSRGESTVSCPSNQAANASERIDAKFVAEHAARGDPLCGRVWDEACFFLAIACINIQHTYNPAIVALGGGMSEAGEVLLGSVRRHLQEQRWSLHDDLPHVVLAELGPDAGVIGAAGLAHFKGL